VQDTETSQMTAYQMGVIVNGAQRGANPSKIANATIFGNYSGPLTSGSLDATTTENVVTSQFAANAGDSLLIAFSTDVTSGYDSSAGNWNGAFVLVDNLMLNPVQEAVIPEPATWTLVALGLLGVAAGRRRNS
jgi:hypothetical protein